MEDVNVRLWLLEGNVIAVLLRPLDSVALDVNLVIVIIKVLKMSFVTRRLENVCVTLHSQHLAEDVMSASQATGTFQTADSVSVMDMLIHAIQRLECASTVEMTLWETFVMFVKLDTMEHHCLDRTRCLAENVSVQDPEQVDTVMLKHVTWMI